MKNQITWLKAQEEIILNRISYRKQSLHKLEEDLKVVRELLEKVEQSKKLPQETNAD
ncbi:hypothetical protein [Claveliimonas bilis]|uniref:Uncharacterized protein n=1 Tax=Claveliimonas bilis TaxID=3028070 RepID=A0ABM8I522_9FIRM|nr:hypothetical protein [Claveliimonas bilis]BDZ76949.1 hypothetical protein Lac1_11320 [Claveliimonas bilis]